jgi:arginine repressor
MVADDGTVLIICTGEERGASLHACVEGCIG